MHERRLHVHAEHDAEPDEVDAEVLSCRSNERDDDERQFEEIEKEREQEHEDVDKDKEAQLASGKRGEKVLDPDVTVDTKERQREHAGADQDEHDEGGELRG